MIVWIDAQLSPRIARWLSTRFGVDAIPVRDLGLREASDRRIFDAARSTGAVVMTKDVDFVGILERLGPPRSEYRYTSCGAALGLGPPLSPSSPQCRARPIISSFALPPSGPLRSAIANRGSVRQPASEIPSVGGTSEPRGVDDADVRWWRAIWVGLRGGGSAAERGGGVNFSVKRVERTTRL